MKYQIGSRVTPNEKFWEMYRGVRNPGRQGTVTGLSNTPLRTRVVKWDDLKTTTTISIGFLTPVEEN